MDQKTALLYAQLNSFKFLVRKTEGFIRWALEQVENPYVACSFGKDSAVMLHMVLKYKPDIPVYWVVFKETPFLDNYEEVVQEWKERFGINLTAFYQEAEVVSEFDDRKAINTEGHDSYFVGITKEESVSRRISLKKEGKFFRKKDGLIRISPIADWTVKDVTAYIFSQKLPTLRTYLKHGFEQRTVTGFSEDMYSFRENQLQRLKESDFQKYQQLILRFPELKQYA